MGFLKKSINDNLLLKVTSMNSIGIVIKVVFGFITQKALAIFVGPQGIGVIGSFRDFVTVAQSISSLGLSHGVIKYVAEFKTETKKLAQVLSTSFFLISGVALSVGIVLFFTASHWNQVIFDSGQDYTTLIRITAIGIPLFAMNLLLLAIIQGFSKYKLFVFINVAINVTTAVAVVLLAWQFALKGALYAVLAAPVLSFLVTLGFVFKKRSKHRFFNLSGFDFSLLKNFGSFIVMAMLSSLALPIIRIAIRDYIGVVDNQAAVGYWEAMNRISNFYLMFISSLLTMYLLPKLSETKTNSGFRKEIGHFYKTVFPILTLGLVLIYLFRNFIVTILLTGDFAPMEPLFIWQLLGDFFKVASLVIAYQFWAKNLFWPYIISESISLAITYFASIYLIGKFGFVGASMAHFVTYVLYFGLILFLFRKKLFGKVST